MSKMLYCKKYGFFCWYLNEQQQVSLLAFTGHQSSSKYIKVYPKKTNLNAVLKYYKNFTKISAVNLIGEPFIVRITDNTVRLKSGVLLIDWAHRIIGVDNHEYVPFKWIPDFDDCSA